MALNLSEVLHAMSMGKTTGYILISQLEADEIDATEYNITAEIENAAKNHAPNNLNPRDRERWGNYYAQGMAKVFAEYVD